MIEKTVPEGFQVASRRGPNEQRSVPVVLEQRSEDQQHPRSLKGDGYKKVFIRTFGCQMNEYDSDKIHDVLRVNLGFEKTVDVTEARVLVANTCSIREKAEDKLYSLLGEWWLLKKEQPELILIVAGCVGSQEGAHILKRAPYVDIICGPQTLHRLPEMIMQLASTSQRKAVVDVSFPEIEKFDRLPDPVAKGPTAYVSIMEGCSKYCSYCIVPYTRGEEISRPFDDVIAEVMSLAEQGVREITLLGQNVNDYRGAMHHGGTADLALLIHYIAAIDTIARIRFTTSHPIAFSDSLIEAYQEVPKLANHLHLPVQSGSNRILAMMKRGYSVEQYQERIQKLRAVRPDISISTDIIVGFPTETDQDFQQTMDLVTQAQFDGGFSFTYSQRPGTPAAWLVDNIDESVKKERLSVLQAQLKCQHDQFSRRMLETEQSILVTGPAKKHSDQYSGRTENNRVVNFSLPPRFQHEQYAVELIGSMARVYVKECLPNSLRGQLSSITGSSF